MYILMEMFWNKILIFAIRITSILTTMHKKVLLLFLALMMGTAVQAQEIEKVDKFPSGYINGVCSLLRASPSLRDRQTEPMNRSQ